MRRIRTLPRTGTTKRAGRIGAIFAAVGMALAPSADAGTEGGTIQPQWFLYGDGVLFFELSGTHQSSPCSITERWAIDTNTPLGKTQLAVFMTAYAMNRALSLVGTAACVHNNTELVYRLTVMD